MKTITITLDENDGNKVAFEGPFEDEMLCDHMIKKLRQFLDAYHSPEFAVGGKKAAPAPAPACVVGQNMSSPLDLENYRAG